MPPQIDFSPSQLHIAFLPVIKGSPWFVFPTLKPHCDLAQLGLYGAALYSWMLVCEFSFPAADLCGTVVVSELRYVTKSLVHQVSNTGMKLVNTEWIVQSLIHGKPMTDYKRFSLNWIVFALGTCILLQSFALDINFCLNFQFCSFITYYQYSPLWASFDLFVFSSLC